MNVNPCSRPLKKRNGVSWNAKVHSKERMHARDDRRLFLRLRRRQLPFSLSSSLSLATTRRRSFMNFDISRSDGVDPFAAFVRPLSLYLSLSPAFRPASTSYPLSLFPVCLVFRPLSLVKTVFRLDCWRCRRSPVSLVSSIRPRSNTT